MFKGKIENWILINSVINPVLKIEGNIYDQRIITSKLKKILNIGFYYIIYTESGSIYLLSIKGVTEGRLLNETCFATLVNMSENTPKDFIQNMTHRIDYYNVREKISENWELVERELPLEKITYEVDEGFILV
tara:strand:- start:16409 stop:16807 length:399 start_codon:yes stop_codon:yes gene_type:complete